jgi:alpha-L-fucosidase
MAGSWSYVPNDKYKSTNTIIHNLIDIVSKGGNYLLNIGPGPDGEWHDEAYVKLREIGKWIKLNGEAIYNTRPVHPYKEKNVCFTQSKDGKSIYVHYLLKENEATPAEINFTGPVFNNKAIVTMLSTDTKLRWKKENNIVKIGLPRNLKARHAVVIKIVPQ